MADETGLYNIAPGETPQAVASRRRMAEALLQEGTSTKPIQHWTQGLANVAKALMGGYGMYQADQEDASGISKAMKTAYGALRGDQPPDSVPMAPGGPMPAGGQAPRAPAGGALPPLPSNVPASQVSLDDPSMRAPQAANRNAFQNPYARSQMPASEYASPGFLRQGSAVPPASPVASALAGGSPMSAQASATPQGPGAAPAPQPPRSGIDPRLVASLANPYLPKPMQELAMAKAKEQMKPPEFTHFTAGDKNMVFDKSNPGNVRDLGAGSENKFTNVAELRKEIHTLPSYKNWTQAEPIYRSMLETEGTDSKASDLNLVYGLSKIFDPTSVVREGEMIMVKNTASLPDWLVGSINSLNGGARLQPETRKAILAEAKIRAGQYYDMVQQDVAPYRGIAQRFNMHPDDIIPPIRPLPAGAPALQAAPATQAAAAPPARAPVRVNSPMEAAKLPKGTPIEFQDPRNGGAWTRGST